METGNTSMSLELNAIGKEIGIVLSGASASIAPIAIRRDVELDVHEEDLVLIVDDRLKNYYMLGVIRWVTRYEPFLRRGIHNVYVEHPEALNNDMVMPFTNAYVEIYAGIRISGNEGFIDSNIHAPTPSSKVFKLNDANPLTNYINVLKPISVGEHKYTGWKLPLDVEWINYHVGVFGATGSGKSRLVLKLVSEARKHGAKFIVFDHTGVDYSTYARQANITVIDASKIKIPIPVLAQTLSSLMGFSSSSTYAEYVEVAVACHDRIVNNWYSDGFQCVRMMQQIQRESNSITIKSVQKRQ